MIGNAVTCSPQKQVTSGCDKILRTNATARYSNLLSESSKNLGDAFVRALWQRGLRRAARVDGPEAVGCWALQGSWICKENESGRSGYRRPRVWLPKREVSSSILE